jgi:hypothetical protein
VKHLAQLSFDDAEQHPQVNRKQYKRQKPERPRVVLYFHGFRCHAGIGQTASMVRRIGKTTSVERRRLLMLDIHTQEMSRRMRRGTEEIKRNRSIGEKRPQWRGQGQRVMVRGKGQGKGQVRVRVRLGGRVRAKVRVRDRVRIKQALHNDLLEGAVFSGFFFVARMFPHVWKEKMRYTAPRATRSSSTPIHTQRCSEKNTTNKNANAGVNW